MTTESVWSSERSAELYNLEGWGHPYFSARSDGELVAHPDGPDGPASPLTDIVAMARRQGLSLPLLVRFDGILGHRLRTLEKTFATAIREYDFTGRYRPVYPIKVNQQRRVAQELLLAGRDSDIGLEVGSKPELFAVVALLERPSLIICNGYKDETYIEMACLAVRLGHEVVVVIEKPSEIETVARVVEREGREAAPTLGLRARLAARGSGRWDKSTGDRAKFGLSVAQLVEAVDWLDEVDLLDRVQLLHFHIGSQITAIRSWKAALREASRVYVELVALGCPLKMFDVGGGLAVDYDGSRTKFESSMNYSEQEYANDVVWHVHDACAKANVAAPDIVTESGRALTAHHSMMIVEVTGASRLTVDDEAEGARADEHELVAEFRENLALLSRKTILEVYHDAFSLREEMLTRFNLGLVDLTTRATCESLFFKTAERVARLATTLEHVPEELEGLRSFLADTYFCNFSVFQSVPDHWAIRQVFPVMPIHRLDERPTGCAVLGDLTCDSDGKIDRFPDLRDVKDVLEVHPLRDGESYMLGIFLVGAYQEILGDLHNLFGDTDAVHVDFDAEGRAYLSECLQGEPVGKVLSWVGYEEDWLMGRYDRALKVLVDRGELTPDEADEVRVDLVAGLAGNTYLTERSVKTVRADDLAEMVDDDDPQPAPESEPRRADPAGTAAPASTSQAADVASVSEPD